MGTYRPHAGNFAAMVVLLSCVCCGEAAAAAAAAPTTKNAVSGTETEALSKMIQMMGPRYTVDVKAATAEEVVQVSSGPHVVTTKDARGVTFVCQMPVDEEPEAAVASQDEVEGKAVDGTEADGVDSGAIVAAAIGALRKAPCTTKKTGWWTYQVCHFKEVRQYHEDGSKIDDEQNWSLGTIVPPSDLGEFVDSSKSSRRARAVHPFGEGAQCSESNEPRRGEVHYECRGSSAGHRPTIHEILEPSTCVYHIIVHVPALCEAEEFKPPSSMMPGASDSPAAVAKLYRERCFYRSEGWWTYEFCVNKHVRQFRQEPGKAAAKVESDTSPEFYLGMLTPAEVTTLDYVSKMHPKDPHRSYAAATYSDGSPCDLVDQTRATEVRMKCAPDGSDRLVSIQEVAICKYRLIFASAKMCALGDFAAAEEKVREILCYYEDEEEAEAVAAAEQEERTHAAHVRHKSPHSAPTTPQDGDDDNADDEHQHRATVTAQGGKVGVEGSRPKVKKLVPKQSKPPPAPPPHRQMTADATPAPKAATDEPVKKHDAHAKRRQEARSVKAMNVTKIKAELITRGLDISGMVEKSELMEALVEARVEGVQTFTPGGAAPSSYKPPVETQRHMEVSGQQVAKLMSKLQNTCSQVNMGWWTFSVCHLSKVAQWHEENSQIVEGLHWSLGEVEPPEDLGAFKVHSSTGVGAFVAHTFSGGQVCHEVDKARGGVLHYVCDPDSAEVQQASSEKSAMEMYTGVVLKVEEPSKCQYRITMHVLALCALPEFGASP